jgi:glucokinase
MPKDTEPLAIGVDAGATKIAAALVGRSGDVMAERVTPTLAADGPPAVIRRIAALAEELLQEADAPVAGIGVGTPGYVDPATGVVTNAVNLGWSQVSLVKTLREHLGDERPILAENDANVMALGECYYGSAVDCAHFVYVSIGSGLGSGLVADRRLISGVDHRAAELGHLSLDCT